jgi:opacity protein-like surface antigen
VNRSSIYALGALALLTVGARASAQGYYEQTFAPQEPVHWHLQIGYSPTVGSTGQYFDGGITLGGGLSWRPRPNQPFALRADIEYSHFGATRNLIALNEQLDQIQIDSGYGEVIGLNVDGQYKRAITPWISGFALAGIGVDHMRVALTQTVAYGSYFCDPWFGFCSYGLVPGDMVVASGSSTRLSWNAGVGLDFLLRDGQTFFVEARYQRIETSQPTAFVPLTVGLRF